MTRGLINFSWSRGQGAETCASRGDRVGESDWFDHDRWIMIGLFRIKKSLPFCAFNHDSNC